MSHNTSAWSPCLRFRESAGRTPCNSGVSVPHKALLVHNKVDDAAVAESMGIFELDAGPVAMPSSGSAPSYPRHSHLDWPSGLGFPCKRLNPR
jgi:hypothetical protein